MSVVAVRVTPSGYHIAADSATVWNWSTTKSDDQAKLIHTNNMHVGCSGNADEIGLFQVYCITHRPESPRRSDILSFLAEFGKWRQARVNNGAVSLNYILGLSSCVYYGCGIDASLVTSYAAIGAGMDYALAALYLSKSPKQAVKTAIELNAYCTAPVVKYKRRW